VPNFAVAQPDLRIAADTSLLRDGVPEPTGPGERADKSETCASNVPARLFPRGRNTMLYFALSSS
jgi:hypothetical protein